jgi:hypothetical protein
VTQQYLSETTLTKNKIWNGEGTGGSSSIIHAEGVQPMKI